MPARPCLLSVNILFAFIYSCGCYHIPFSNSSDKLRLSWSDAQQFCIDTFDSHLASIHSLSDFQHIIELMTLQTPESRSLPKFWIGLYMDELANFIWIDNSDFDFLPNISMITTIAISSHYTEAHCVTLRGFGNDTFALEVTNCSFAFTPICNSAVGSAQPEPDSQSNSAIGSIFKDKLVLCVFVVISFITGCILLLIVSYLNFRLRLIIKKNNYEKRERKTEHRKPTQTEHIQTQTQTQHHDVDHTQCTDTLDTETTISTFTISTLPAAPTVLTLDTSDLYECGELAQKPSQETNQTDSTQTYRDKWVEYYAGCKWSNSNSKLPESETGRKPTPEPQPKANTNTNNPQQLAILPLSIGGYESSKRSPHSLAASMRSIQTSMCVHSAQSTPSRYSHIRRYYAEDLAIIEFEGSREDQTNLTPSQPYTVRYTFDESGAHLPNGRAVTIKENIHCIDSNLRKMQNMVCLPIPHHITTLPEYNDYSASETESGEAEEKERILQVFHDDSLRIVYAE